MQISAQQLGALDVIAAIEFLVDAVRGVGRAAHGQQEHVLARGLLEREGYGDAAGRWPIGAGELVEGFGACPGGGERG